MPEAEELVINTGPLLALIAGVGDLSLLELLYKRVLVPFEVCQEIEAGGASGFGVSEFKRSSFIEKRSNPLTIPPFLRNALVRLLGSGLSNMLLSLYITLNSVRILRLK